jgi:hypothetical protein
LLDALCLDSRVSLSLSLSLSLSHLKTITLKYMVFILKNYACLFSHVIRVYVRLEKFSHSSWLSAMVCVLILPWLPSFQKWLQIPLVAHYWFPMLNSYFVVGEFLSVLVLAWAFSSSYILEPLKGSVSILLPLNGYECKIQSRYSG